MRSMHRLMQKRGDQYWNKTNITEFCFNSVLQKHTNSIGISLVMQALQYASRHRHQFSLYLQGNRSNQKRDKQEVLYKNVNVFVKTFFHETIEAHYLFSLIIQNQSKWTFRLQTVNNFTLLVYTHHFHRKNFTFRITTCNHLLLIFNRIQNDCSPPLLIQAIVLIKLDVKFVV